VSSQSTSEQLERRASKRFSIERTISYRVVSHDPVGASGSGKTVNISSGGILIVTDRPLSPGMRLEIEVDWPLMTAEVGSLKLFVEGQIVRSKRNDVALAGVKILRFTFHTTSR
jgi:c-di-GMP-binding flagellar brake protein YcgR